MSRFRMIVICLALLLEGMSTSGINVQLVALRDELGIAESELQLVAGAFLIAYAGLLPIAGALADRLDRRAVFLWGIALFGIGCVVCAAAPGAAVLIAGRVVQGAGAALSAPAALALITAGLPEGAARNRAVAIYGAMGAIGFSLGLVAPGAAVTAFGWRWSFLVSLPAVALVLAATWGVGRGARRTGTPPPDVVGAVLLTASLMLGVHLVGAEATLPSPVLIGEAVAVAVLVIALVRRRGVRDIPRAVVAEPRMRAACLALGGLFAGVVGSMYALSLALGSGRGATALTVALLIVPQPVFFSLTAGLGARSVTRWGAPRTFALGAIVFVASLVGLASAGAVAPPAVLTAMAGVGVALGLCFPAASAGAVDATPPESRATTAALLTTAQNVGGALGIAALTALGAVPQAGSPVGAGPAMLWSAAMALGGVVAAAAVLLLAPARPRRTTFRPAAGPAAGRPAGRPAGHPTGRPRSVSLEGGTR